MYRYYLWHSVWQQAKSLKPRPPQEIWGTGRGGVSKWTLKQLATRQFWNVVCVPTDTAWLRRLTLLGGRHQLFHTSIICCRGSSRAPVTGAYTVHTHGDGERVGQVRHALPSVWPEVPPQDPLHRRREQTLKGSLLTSTPCSGTHVQYGNNSVVKRDPLRNIVYEFSRGLSCRSVLELMEIVFTKEVLKRNDLERLFFCF